MHDSGAISTRMRHFKENAVGIVKANKDDFLTVGLIGSNETWDVPKQEVIDIDVLTTGDKYNQKICNTCHCLLSVSEFSPNQNNVYGVVRRPSCKQCRTDIDKRAPKSRQAKQFEKCKPKKGIPLRYSFQVSDLSKAFNSRHYSKNSC